MQIVIIGYGKMGKMIQHEAAKLSIPISGIINGYNELVSYKFQNQDIAMEFTEPASCFKNIQILTSKGVNVVCGTTGWYQDIDLVKNLVSKNNIGFIYASNFSIGVNIFWQIIKKASVAIDKFDNYDVMGHEIHHRYKKDSPSGTALTTAQILIDNISRKNKVITDKIDREMQSDEVHFSSSRCGSIVGMHEIIFDSPNDSIKISHHSKERSTYALGAIRCANWIKGKKGFYSIKSFMDKL